MAELRPHYIDVDLKKNTQYNVPVVTQNDTATHFIIRVTDDGLTDPELLDAYQEITMTSQRPDGESFYLTGTRIPGTNEIEFHLGTDETAFSGSVLASLQFYLVEDASRYTSAQFRYDVKKDLTKNYTPTQREETLVEVVLRDGPGVIQEAREAKQAVDGALVDLEQDKTAAIERLDEVTEENKTVFRQPVATFADLATTYPSPEHGTTVRVTSEAATYRYSDGNWVKTDEYNPTAIDQVTAQLADKASESEVFLKSKGININDLDEPTRQAFLEAQGIDVNYVLGENNVGTINYADDSVIGKKLSSKITKPKNVNLLDEKNATQGGYYNQSTGLWVTNTSYRSSNKIMAKKGEVISKNFGNHVTFWTSADVFVSGLSVTSLTKFEVPNNNDISYFLLSLPNSADPTKTMVVKSDVLPVEYVEFGHRILDIQKENLRNKSVSFDKLDDDIYGMFSEGKVNILNEEKTITGYFGNTGDWRSGSSYRSSEAIPCIAGETFARTIGADSLVGNHVTYWNSADEFIIGANIGAIAPTFTVPNNDQIDYFKINISNNTDRKKTMIVRGEKLPQNYIPYITLDVSTENYKEKSITSDKLSDELVNKYFNHDYVKPFSRVVNPVVTKEIVTDRTSVASVADPFIVLDEGRYHMFFEVLQGVNPNTGVASDEIGHAYSDNLKDWTYTQIVLSREEFGHRSAYPNVFKVDNDWYMLPDLMGVVYLYRAIEFPLRWERIETLLNGGSFVDTNVFKMNDVWYLTTTDISSHSGVSLYYNTSGDWKNQNWVPHPIGLIIPNTDAEKDHRCAGNPIMYDGYVTMPVQIRPTNTGVYGEYTKLYKIGNLSPTTAIATDLGKLTYAKNDGGWESRSMHHISNADYLNGKIYAVDGTSHGTVEYKIGFYVDNL